MKNRKLKYLFSLLLIFFYMSTTVFSQVSFQINSGDPNFPFPQFKDYKGGISLATQNGEGVPHAEMEQRIRDAYQILTNNLTYNVNKGGTYGAVTVSGVKYIMPHDGFSGADVTHCACVEADGYYLLAMAYMGDKATFDGYYMWMHDRQFQKTQRFIDCIINSPGYSYSPGISGAGSFGNSTNVLGGALTGNSAMDGDVDLALALLVAWKQWGDNGTICTNPCTGQPVTYKDEAIKYIKTMVDTTLFNLNWTNYVTGIIGFDGYHKGGDSWGETTNWATGGYKGMIPEAKGSTMNYVDYAAPSYFHSFAEMLTAENESPWCIDQYKRGEASDDWLIGQAHAKGYISWAGQYTVVGTTTNFTSFMASEDNRFAWRTHLNYLWNGAPVNTWNPVTHQYTAGSNSYEYDAAIRMANFMKAPEAAPYNNACRTHNTLTYGGPPNVRWQYNPDGTSGGAFPLNWAQGTSSPAAVVSGDRNLMAQMFRQCVIEWDQYNDNAQKYLTSRPRYFHEWNRLLGMLVLSGNYHDPLDFSTQPNMKVYLATDKTYASSCDEITYTISYRNYGKDDAHNVIISDTLPNGISYLSSTKPATLTGKILTFNIGTVAGFKTGGLAATMDSIVIKVKVEKSATGVIKNRATVKCSDGSGWVSNEYPNRITATMERNWVDIINEHPLSITKIASKSTVKPGDTLSYTIVVKNKSVPFLNGGRSAVTIAGGHSGLGANASTLTLKYRIYHGAEEAYINYKNYRVSYFLNKPGPPTWQINTTVNEGSSVVPTTTQENISPGATWNHRFILTFPDQLATITPHLAFYSGQGRYIHEGALMPQRLVFDVHASSWMGQDWTNDWSSEPTMQAADGDVYWPIANDFTNPSLLNQPVLKYHPNNCSNNVTKTITKQLVEEWDGYCWRRIYGDAPISGRELNNVVVSDILPTGVTFVGFTAGYPVGTVNGKNISWDAIAQLKINDSIVYKFWMKVDGACPKEDETLTNIAKASANNECDVFDTVVVQSMCDSVSFKAGIISKNQVICYHSSPLKFNSVSAPIGGDGNYVYTWQSSSDSLVWLDISGANDSVYTADTLIQTTWFRRKVTSMNLSKYSNVVKVEVLDSIVPGEIGINQNMCAGEKADSIVGLLASSNFSFAWLASTDSITYSLLSGENNSFLLPGVVQQNMYYKRISISQSCGADTSDHVSIWINEKDEAGIENSGPFCLLDPSVDLTLSSGSSTGGTWSGNGITNVNAGTFDPQTAGTGKHTVQYISAGICRDTAALDIDVVDAMHAEISDDIISLCEDTASYEISLDASSTTGGTWLSTPDALINDDGVINPTYGAAGNSYFVYYVVNGGSAGCAASDSVEISLMTREITSVDSPHDSVCSGDAPFSLQVNKEGGMWLGDFNSTLFDPSVFTAGKSYKAIYTLLGESGKCPASDSVVIFIRENKQVDLSSDQEVLCVNSFAITLHASPVNGIFSGSGINAQGVFDPKIVGLGKHKVYYQLQNSCGESDSIEIQVDSLPILIIVPEESVGCSPLQVNFSQHISSIVKEMTWNFDDGSALYQSHQNEEVSHVYGISNGKYFESKIFVDYENGCKDTTSVKVSLENQPVSDFSFDEEVNVLNPWMAFQNLSQGAQNYQ